MVTLVLVLALIQGIPIAPQVGGTVSGVLKNAEGKPAAKVRVSARTQQDSTSAVALASLAETDENGRYTIENIPPGQYYIVAGNLDRSTYYPGTQDIAAAKLIQITAGARITGFDFVVIDASRQQSLILITGPPISGSPRVRLDLQVVAETGSRTPVASAAGPVTLQFERVSDGAVSSVSSTTPTTNLELLPTGTNTDYRVRVLNLPEGFLVRGMTYRGADVSSGILALPTAATVSTALQAAVQAAAAPTANIQSVATLLGPETLSITIAEAPAGTSTARGVRVTGLNRRSDTHPVFLSGRPGTVFSDGTFEFRDVPPGRHVIASIDFPGRALGTTLIVGDQNIYNVTLDDIAALPTDIQIPVIPGPSGNGAPGSKLRPVVLYGVVFDQMTRQAPACGQVYITGRRGPSYHLDAQGRFEVQGLLPGTYELEIQLAGYPNRARQLKVGIDDLRLAFEIEK
jgi:Carboxypeptidase regulatory-like domain